MMSRKPIQVPAEVKERVEGLKNQLRARTEYEVIEKLIGYHDKQRTHLVVENEEVRDTFRNLKSELQIRNDEDMIKLLLEHYKHSESLSKPVFDLYVKMRRW